MILHLGCIVEGQGDARAVPRLVQRIRQEVNPSLDVRMLRQPWRVGRQKLIQAGKLESVVEMVARQLALPRGILILVDSDDDCPARLGPELVARARQARPDIPIGVVLAKREFETWFLASIESIKGKCGIVQSFSDLPEPETIRGAKEYLQRLTAPNRRYGKDVDQEKLTAVFDMGLARSRSDSFDKCWRVMERLFTEAAAEPSEDRPESGFR